jgi:hypothetical protein
MAAPGEWQNDKPLLTSEEHGDRFFVRDRFQFYLHEAAARDRVFFVHYSDITDACLCIARLYLVWQWFHDARLYREDPPPGDDMWEGEWSVFLRSA